MTLAAHSLSHSTSLCAANDNRRVWLCASHDYRSNGLTYKDSRASGTGDDLEWIHNKRDRVSELKVNTVSTATYLYSADGSRASKTYGGASTHYLYDEEGNLLAEHNGSTGAVIREYVYLEGMPLAQAEGGNTYYFHSDQVNQPQKITDASDTIVWNRFAQPFGENVSVSGATATPLRFPGQYSDPEDANSYNYFRDYDPTLGRYLQPDPIGLDGGLNLYGYVNQNPLLYVDPRGEWGFLLAASPEVLAGAATLGAGILANALPQPTKNAIRDAINDVLEACSDPEDPCKELQDKMQRHMDGMDRKYNDLLNDKLDLYNKSYDVNPRGELTGYGTWLGHFDRYNRLINGLNNMISQAEAMGCPVPQRARDLVNRTPPASPLR